MKALKRGLALVLAAAMAITLLPGGFTIVTAKAAEISQYIEWDTTSDPTLVSGNDTTVAAKELTYDTMKYDASYLQVPARKKGTLVAGTGGYTEKFQWYEDRGDGGELVEIDKDKVLSAATDTLNFNELSYADGGYLTNKKTEYRFRCDVSMEFYYLDDAGNRVYTTVPENGTVLHYNVSIKYDDITKKSGYELKDYFTITKEDEIVKPVNLLFNESNNPDGESVVNIIKDSEGAAIERVTPSSDTRFMSTWTAHFTDGTDMVMNEDDEETAEPYIDLGSVSFTAKPIETIKNDDGTETAKKVESYTWKLQLCNGYQELKSLEKKYVVNFNPYTSLKTYVNNEDLTKFKEDGSIDSVTVTARNNETVDLMVSDEDLLDWNDFVDLDGTLYQWYSVDENNEKTALKNQTSNELSIKASDAITGYICKVTLKGTGSTGYLTPTEVGFRINVGKSGYFLFSRSDESVYAALGTETALRVNDTVDKGYTITREWYQFQPQYDADGTYTGNKWTKLEGKNDAELKVTLEDPNEYETNDELVLTEGAESVIAGTFCNFVQVVTVTAKNETPEEPRCYAYCMIENAGFEIETNGAYVHSSSRHGKSQYANQDGHYAIHKVNASGWYIDNFNSYNPTLELSDGEAGTLVFRETTENNRQHVEFNSKNKKKWVEVVGASAYYIGTSAGGNDKRYYEKGFIEPKSSEYDGVYIVQDEYAEYISSVTGESSFPNKCNYYNDALKKFVNYEGVIYFYKEMEMTTDADEISLVGELDKADEQYLCIYRPYFDTKDVGKTLNYYGYEKDDLSKPYDCAIIFTVAYEKSKAEAEETIEDPGLKAYVKNDIIKAALDDKVVLDAVAEDKDQAEYPITYQWSKLEKGGEYKDIAGATKASYVIDSCKDDSYTWYRVRVTAAKKDDEKVKQTIELFVQVVKSYDAAVDITANTTRYVKKTGEKVTLKAEFHKDEDTAINMSDVTYKWYKILREKDELYTDEYPYDKNYYNNFEKYITDKYSEYAYELTDVDGNTLGLTVDEDTYDYAYYCVASYTYEDKAEPVEIVSYIGTDTDEDGYIDTDIYSARQKAFRFLIDEKDTTTYLEPLSATKISKNFGEQVKLSARVVSDDESLKLDKVTYEWEKWYNDNNTYGYKKIPNAAASSYTVNLEEADDFTKYRLSAYKEDGTRIGSKSFEVFMNAEVYLLKDNDTLYVNKGEDAVIEPSILNVDGLELTYQWSSGDALNELPITGATEAAYTLERVGDNEDGQTYTLEIRYKGALITTYTCTIAVQDPESETGIRLDYAKDCSRYMYVAPHGSVTLKVKADNYDNAKQVFYQWYYGNNSADYDYDGMAIGGETTDTLTLEDVVTDRVYVCKVTNDKGETAVRSFYVQVTNGFQLEEDSAIAVATYLGKDVTLKATATAAADYKDEILYQWYKYNEEYNVYVKLKDATDPVYTVSNVQMEDLTNYKCIVSCQDDEEIIKYLLYVPTELVVESSPYYPKANTAGVVTMSVSARAASYEKISYQWYKDSEELENENGASLVINELTTDKFGTYYCEVSTQFAEKTLEYELKTMIDFTQTHGSYAEAGDTVTFRAKIVNPAKDVKYSQQWYMKDLYKVVDDDYTDDDNYNEGDNELVDNDGSDYIQDVKLDCTQDTLTVTLPKPGNLTNQAYQKVKYYCVTETEILEDTKDTAYKFTKNNSGTITVFDRLTVVTNGYPETTHPAERVSAKKYTVPGATSLTISFDSRCDFDSSGLKLIDKNGKIYYPYWSGYDHVAQKPTYAPVTIPGDTVIFLYDYSSSSSNRSITADGLIEVWGYKVTSISAVMPAAPGSTPEAGVSAGTLRDSSGTSYTVTDKGAVQYKEAPATANGSVSIPETVTVNGVSYKVTSVADNAFKGNTKITSVKIGKNITSIGANAFSGCTKLKSVTISSSVTEIKANAFSKCTALTKITIPASVSNIGKSAFEGCKKLKTITIKSTKLTKKTVGAKAFKGVSSKVTVKVPKKKLEDYKKILKSKGLPKTAKVK